MKKIINIFYDIRQQEWRSVLLMFALHFLLMVVLYFLKPARDSLFLVKNGPQDLPYVYILLAVVSVPATQFLSYLMRMYSVRSVLIWTLPFLGLNILIIRWFIQFNYEWIFMAFYIWVGIFSILVISLYWILANAVFKPAQSKRLFSFLTLGAILGAITGSQTSSILVSWGFLTTENLLYLCVGLLVISTVSLFFISIDSQEDENNKTVKRKKEKKASFKEIKKALKSPYQLILASVIGLTMITTTFTDFQFKTIAYDSFPVQAELTSFLGTFYAGISLASLAIQVLFSSQIIKRLGLSGAILTRPAGMMIGAILMVFEPVLASIVFLNGFDNATRYSIDKTGRELLFLPLSQNIKEQTKVFIDIFVDRFSRGLGGVVLLGFIFFLDVSVYSLTYLVIALLACWIILGVKAKKEYTEKFRKSIRNQLIETNTITLDLNEPNIYSIIQESLNSENDSQILHTLRLLEHSNNEKVVDELKILLNHSNSNIKLEALKLLQNISSVDLTEEVQHLLRDENPEVRLETIYYLCLHSEQDPSDIIKSYLSHNDDKLKSAALGCTSKYSGEISEIVDHGFFETLLKKNDRDAVVVKAQIADSLGFISEKRLAYRYLSELLNDDHPAVVRKTLGAISRQKIDRFIPLLLDKLVDYKYRSDITNTLA
ncbi:MAG: Npt1/Npt2 family nucleotide transporter, partial [Gracilimonas sp.]